MKDTIRAKDNTVKILQCIRSEKLISRAELARINSLTRPTVSQIVGELINVGLVKETGKGSSNIGKKPTLLSIVGDFSYFIGIDLADENIIKGVLCDLAGNTVKTEQKEYYNNFRNIFSQSVAVIKHLSQGIENKISGVGIAISGLLDYKRQEIIFSSNFDIAEKDLREKLECETGFSVLLENRPNAAALAEKLLGKAQKINNFIYISSGRGIGAGIFIDSKLFKGGYGTAGEIGNLSLFSRKKFLKNKRKNHLEYIMRTDTLIKEYKTASQKEKSLEEIIEEYKNDLSPALELINSKAEYLAAASCIISNIFNPEVLILSGNYKIYGEKFNKYLKKIFSAHFANPNEQTDILYSSLDKNAVAQGGAILIIEKVFKLERKYL